MPEATFTVARVVQRRSAWAAALALCAAWTQYANAETTGASQPAEPVPAAAHPTQDPQTPASVAATPTPVVQRATEGLASTGAFAIDEPGDSTTAPPVAPDDKQADISAPTAPAPVDAAPSRPEPTIQSAPGATFATTFPPGPQQRDRVADPAQSRKARSHSRSVAAMLDAGLPDGVMLGAAYRPTFWSRLQAGAGTNSISPGVRAGVVLVPFSAGPSFTVEGGWYFEGNASGVVKQLAGPNYTDNAAAQHLGYKFVNLHAGLDFGSSNATFFIHGGMSYIRTTLHNTNNALGGQTVSAQGAITSYSFNQDLTLNAWIPSLKLGLLVYLV